MDNCPLEVEVTQCNLCFTILFPEPQEDTSA
jgi:hypothetical protein